MNSSFVLYLLTSAFPVMRYSTSLIIGHQSVFFSNFHEEDDEKLLYSGKLFTLLLLLSFIHQTTSDKC